MNTGNQKLLLLIVAFVVLNLRCTLDDASVIEPSTETLYFSSITMTPDSINTDTIFVNGTQTPNDVIQLSATVVVQSNRQQQEIGVVASVKEPGSSTVLSSIALHDDGVTPDAVKGDSLYSGTLTVSIKRSFYGKLLVTASGSSSVANSTSISTYLVITRNNRPPVIDSVEVPDTLVVGSSTQLLNLYAYVNDEDGLADIERVFFRSYLLPDTTTGSAPFLLYDDGGANNASGNTDKVPGDGEYTLTVQFPPTATKGIRRFVFQAIDKSGTLSNSVQHDIVVK